jgi:hypothetical protein
VAAIANGKRSASTRIFFEPETALLQLKGTAKGKQSKPGLDRRLYALRADLRLGPL